MHLLNLGRLRLLHVLWLLLRLLTSWHRWHDLLLIFIVILLTLDSLLRLTSCLTLWTQYSSEEFSKHLLFDVVILMQDILVLVPVKHNHVTKLTIFVVGHVWTLTLEYAPSWWKILTWYLRSTTYVWIWRANNARVPWICVTINDLRSILLLPIWSILKPHLRLNIHRLVLLVNGYKLLFY